MDSTSDVLTGSDASWAFVDSVHDRNSRSLDWDEQDVEAASACGTTEFAEVVDMADLPGNSSESSIAFLLDSSHVQEKVNMGHYTLVGSIMPLICACVMCQCTEMNVL